MRIFQAFFLLVISVLIITAGALPWVEKQNAIKAQQGKIPSDFLLNLPFAEKPQATMANLWLHGGEINVKFMEQQLERAVKARPLYPNNWLLLAKVKFKLGLHDEAARLAEYTQTLAPTRSYILWNLAMFWLSYPDQEKAISLLHDYLLAKPQDVYKVMLVAYRLDADKERLLDKLIPKSVAQGYTYDQDYYQAKVLHSALRLKNLTLAHFSWSKITNKLLDENPHASTIKRYLRALIANNEKKRAQSVWHEIQLTSLQDDDVFNHSFEGKLLNYGFGWQVRKRKGAQFERSYDNAIEGNYSLKINLDGTENINLYYPVISIPVEQGKRYQLSLYWKGEGITTRANPFIEVYFKDEDKNKYIHSEKKRGSWHWTRVVLDFDVPMETHFITLRLRRRPTKALDKLISGVIYLDDVQLKRYN